MSDTAPTSDVISATNPAMSMRSVETPPAIDPGFHLMMMDLGTRLSAAMGIKKMLPSQVNQATGLSPDIIRRVRLGEEPDVGVRALAAIAGAVGCQFQISIIVPQPPGQTGQGSASD